MRRHLHAAVRAEAGFGLLLGRDRAAVVVAGGAGAAAELAPHRLVDFLARVRQDRPVTPQTVMRRREIRRTHRIDLRGCAPSAPARRRSSLLHTVIVPTGG